MGELSRIGVVNMAVDWWTAGGSFTRMLVESLAAAKEGRKGREVELLLLSRKKSGVKDEPVPATIRHFQKPHYAIGEGIVRSIRGLGEKSELYETALRYKASVVLPVLQIDVPRAPVPTIGWIPDFQHRHWPGFYSKASLASRDRAYRQLAERSRLILLSSESARTDLAGFLPEHTAKARVLPFPSLFAFHPPEAADPHATVAKYRLPEKFALVANQFWQHKNHRVVVEAAALLKSRGIQLPVVMTGQPSDFRDPQNRTVSELLQRIAEAGLAGQVTVLGQVAYPELIALMRAAAVMVQPSQSEGWSTVVQDGKALGRPLICSGIATHREQAPEALGFFEWDRPDELAELIGRHWDALTPGPDMAREAECIGREQEFARQHGRKLFQICEEAAGQR
jgi:glycosyltransferase involved in cell wall biosynthesis